MRVLSTIPATFLHAGNFIKIKEKDQKEKNKYRWQAKEIHRWIAEEENQNNRTEKYIQIYKTLIFPLELIDNLNLHLSMPSPRLYLAQIINLRHFLVKLLVLKGKERHFNAAGQNKTWGGIKLFCFFFSQKILQYVKDVQEIKKWAKDFIISQNVLQL